MREMIYEWMKYAAMCWPVFMLVGLWMRAQARDELTVGDLVKALFFGPLYMLVGFDSWNATIWKRVKK